MTGILVWLALVVLATLLFRGRLPLLLYALIATLPFERIGGADVQVGASTVTLRLAQILGPALVLLVLVRAPRDLLPRGFEWLPGAYLVVGAISAVQAVSPVRSVLVMGFTAFVWLVFLGVRRVALDVDRETLWRILAATSLASFAFALFQFLGDLAGLPSTVTGLRLAYTKAVFGFPRIQSFALEPLYLALSLLWPVGLFAARLALRPDGPARLVLYALATTITLTLSRGGYAGTIVTLLAIAVVVRDGRALLRIAIPVVLGVATGVAAVGAASLILYGDLQLLWGFVGHAGNWRDGSANERAVWRGAAFEAFCSAPFTGIGIGNFGRWGMSRLPDQIKPDTIVNNETLELLGETGIFGFLVMVAFIVSIARASVRAWPAAGAEARVWILGLTAALMGVLVQYQTTSTLYITHIWVALGLLVAVQGERPVDARGAPGGASQAGAPPAQETPAPEAGGERRGGTR